MWVKLWNWMGNYFKTFYCTMYSPNKAIRKRARSSCDVEADNSGRCGNIELIHKIPVWLFIFYFLLLLQQVILFMLFINSLSKQTRSVPNFAKTIKLLRKKERNCQCAFFFFSLTKIIMFNNIFDEMFEVFYDFFQIHFGGSRGFKSIVEFLVVLKLNSMISFSLLIKRWGGGWGRMSKKK